MATEPKTLQEAVLFYADPDNCLNFLTERRPEWKDGVICPTCGSKNVAFLKSRRLWQCKTRHPKAQFSIKVGTIFEDPPIGLDKWLVAMWLIANCKNGISSWELHRALGVSQKAAWFMLQRLRLALKMPGSESNYKLGGKDGSGVEVDETFIGGKLKNMHRDRRARFAAKSGHTGGATGKTVVMGILDRDARQVRATVVPNVKRETLQNEVLNNVKFGSPVFTDDAVPYDKLKWRYVHEVVNHAETYVNGRVHTNGL